MTEAEQETLIEKIRKLQAKANDASVSEAEAALYAQKVAELLQKHNLTEAALEIPSGEDQEVTEDRMYNSKTGDPWAQQVAWALAKLYFCDIYLTKLGQKTKVVFVGKPHNIQVAMSMTEWLIKTIGRLANDYAKSPEAKRDFDWTFTRARNGFERGAGERMRQRINQMHREQTRAEPVRNDRGNPGNLPALYQDESKLIEAYKEKLKLAKGRGRGSDTSGGHAARGAAAANSISLNAQVGSKSSTRMLK